MPPSVVKEAGSRCRTTLFAAPPSLCQARGAASFRSESLRLASYHRHEVAKPSNPAGSPSHVGTSSEGMTAFSKAASSSHRSRIEASRSAYHAIGLYKGPNRSTRDLNRLRSTTFWLHARAPPLRVEKGACTCHAQQPGARITQNPVTLFGPFRKKVGTGVQVHLRPVAS